MRGWPIECDAPSSALCGSTEQLKNCLRTVQQMKNRKQGHRKQVKTWNLNKVSKILNLLKSVLVLADIIIKMLK